VTLQCTVFCPNPTYIVESQSTVRFGECYDVSSTPKVAGTE
jgi:hypothetical protein